MDGSLIAFLTSQAQNLALVALLTEAVTETLKMALPELEDRYKQLLAMLVGITLVFALIFPTLTLPLSMRVATAVMTGILVSRGSNFVHDLFKKLGE